VKTPFLAPATWPGVRPGVASSRRGVASLRWAECRRELSPTGGGADSESRSLQADSVIAVIRSKFRTSRSSATRGEPPLGTGDLARLPRDAPHRAPLAPRARPTEVVPRCRPPAGPTVPRRGDAGVDSQVGARESAVGISANSRGAGEARPSNVGHRDPDTPGPPRAQPLAHRMEFWRRIG
jgi:hypothetical protein